MKSTYKRALVYDLETGGLNEQYNSITEIAIVAVDLETLKIIDEFNVMLKPRLDLSYRNEDPLKEAKMLFKNLATKDDSTGIKMIKYKEKDITLKNLDALVEDITKFHNELDRIYPDNILELKDIQEYERSELKDIVKLYFDNSYNPDALRVTKISREMLESEGVEYDKAFSLIKEMFEKHKVGNSKPVISGHNIGFLPRHIAKGKEKPPNGFDNPFMEKLFSDNGSDFFDLVNSFIIDTLQYAKIRWSEMPNYSLGTCSNELGLTLKEAHRALPDTVANANFLIKMLKSFRGEGAQKSNYKRRKFNFNF